MEENKYFVFYGNEDGGQLSILDSIGDLSDFLKENNFHSFKRESGVFEIDPNYWDEGECLIIKGKLVVPKPKSVVEEWALE